MDTCSWIAFGLMLSGVHKQNWVLLPVENTRYASTEMSTAFQICEGSKRVCISYVFDEVG